jgi:hypothetical protein
VAERGLAVERASALVAPPGKSEAGRFGSPTFKAFRHCLWRMMLVSVWFLGIFVLMMTLVWILVDRFAENVQEPLFLPNIFVNAMGIYLMVLGITWPLNLELMLNFGLTRHQHSFALLGAGAVLAAFLVLLGVLARLFVASFTPFEVFTGFIYGFIYGCFLFLIGWFIVLGYQLRRVIAAILSTLIGAALFFLWQPPLLTLYGAASYGPLTTVFNLTEPEITSLPFMVFMLLATMIFYVGLITTILLGTRRISIKP